MGINLNYMICRITFSYVNVSMFIQKEQDPEIWKEEELAEAKNIEALSHSEPPLPIEATRPLMADENSFSLKIL